MKKIISTWITGVLAMALFLLYSCVDLNEDIRSNITTDDYYTTVSDATSAVQSIYNDLTHNTSGDHASIYNRLLVLAVGMMTDDNIPGVNATNPDVRSIGALTQTSTNTRYYELWRQHYEGISRANIAIEKIPAITGDTATLNRLVREAKFLRALYYYNLVRLWGAVPLVLTSTSTADDIELVSRTDTATVYQQIISDLTEATQLPTSYSGTSSFRATSGAAHALLMGVAITRRDWAEAISQYENYLAYGSNSYGYSLFSTYGNNFSSSYKNTTEHIFDAWCVADGSFNMTGTGNTNILSYISARSAEGGADADLPSPTLRQLYSSGDKRAAVTFKDSVLNTSSSTAKIYNPHFNKYYDYNTSSLSNNGVNIPIIRYAEVLLFYAEALNENSTSSLAPSAAYVPINLVRKRAGLADLTTGLTKEQFRDSVFQERHLEFVYEEIRWFDLIRVNGSGSSLLASTLKSLPALAASQGVTSSTYGYDFLTSKASVIATYPTKFLLLPIPASEIQANPNLTQNPDW
jgi:starch-binding outer membrane protein, SusD/RagB family